jgi:hypothetical protein
MSKLIFKDNKWICPTCELSSDKEFKHNCPGKKFSQSENSQDGPSLVTKAFNFTKALAEHIADGGKKRSQEEILEILDLCKACPGGYYNKEKDSCNKCGCPLTASRKFFNKLAMKSQHCPMKYW